MVGSDGELIFLVLKSMPYRYRTKIQQVVQACYPKDFVQSESGKVALKAKHFCVWNQYTESVGVFPLLMPKGFLTLSRDWEPPKTFTPMTLYGLPNKMGPSFQGIDCHSSARLLLKTVEPSTRNCLQDCQTSLNGYPNR